MRKKMLIGIRLKSVSLLRIPKIFFIQEKSTKENFVHRKTTETDFSEGKVKKINSNNENSEKTLFKNGKSKKRVFIFLQDLENKIYWWEKHATSLFRNISWKSVSWWKIPWKLFWFKKFHGNQFRWFQKDQIEFVNEKFPEVCSAERDSVKTAFINGETRTNTISLTGTPDGPISYKCNARKLVFLEENPPISSIGNPRKFLSTTKMCWKSISSEKNLIHNLPWKNAHGKTSVDSFSL